MVTTTVAEHYGPEDGTGMLTPADELDDIEIGDRAGLWFANWGLCTIYTSEHDKITGAVSYMVGAIAKGTADRCLPFPAQWWPWNAGPCPIDGEQEIRQP